MSSDLKRNLWIIAGMLAWVTIALYSMNLMAKSESLITMAEAVREEQRFSVKASSDPILKPVDEYPDIK